MASPSLLTSTSKPNPLTLIRPKSATSAAVSTNVIASMKQSGRRQFVALVAGIVAPTSVFPVDSASTALDEEYVKETEEVINKFRTTVTMDKNDPNIATAVVNLIRKKIK